jgi:hypothetical protein
MLPQARRRGAAKVRAPVGMAVLGPQPKCLHVGNSQRLKGERTCIEHRRKGAEDRDPKSHQIASFVAVEGMRAKDISREMTRNRGLHHCNRATQE